LTCFAERIPVAPEADYTRELLAAIPHPTFAQPHVRAQGTTMSKKPGKSRAKATASSTGRTKSTKKTATRSRPQRATASRTSGATAPTPPARDALDDFIDSAALVMRLPVHVSWRNAIKANLAVTLGMGALVAEFALDDEAEPAPVFEA
jgi:hypothetical protein